MFNTSPVSHLQIFLYVITSFWQLRTKEAAQKAQRAPSTKKGNWLVLFIVPLPRKQHNEILYFCSCSSWRNILLKADLTNRGLKGKLVPSFFWASEVGSDWLNPNEFSSIAICVAVKMLGFGISLLLIISSGVKCLCYATQTKEPTVAFSWIKGASYILFWMVVFF